MADDAELVPRSRASLVEGFTAAVDRHGVVGPHGWRGGAGAAVQAVRALRRRELFRIACADLLGVVPAESGRPAAGSTRSRSGRRCRTSPTRRSARRCGPPSRGSGRGGWRSPSSAWAGSAGPSSATPPTPTCSSSTSRRPASPRTPPAGTALQVAEELRRLLSAPSPEPPLGIDADLRPEGRQGPLVRSLAAYERYYAELVAHLGGPGAAAGPLRLRGRGAGRAFPGPGRPCALPGRGAQPGPGHRDPPDQGPGGHRAAAPRRRPGHPRQARPGRSGRRRVGGAAAAAAPRARDRIAAHPAHARRAHRRPRRRPGVQDGRRVPGPRVDDGEPGPQRAHAGPGSPERPAAPPGRPSSPAWPGRWGARPGCSRASSSTTTCARRAGPGPPPSASSSPEQPGLRRALRLDIAVGGPNVPWGGVHWTDSSSTMRSPWEAFRKVNAMARHRPVDPRVPEDRPTRTNLSRRRFLTGIGAGTAGAAVTLAPGRAQRRPHPGGTPRPRPTGSGASFPASRRSRRPTAQVKAALTDIGKPGGILDAQGQPRRRPGPAHRRPEPEPQQPRQPVPHRRHDVLRPVPRPRHDVRHHVAARGTHAAGVLAQHPHAGAGPGLRLRRRPGREPAPVPVRPDQAAHRVRRPVRGRAAQRQRVGHHRRPPQRREHDHLWLAGGVHPGPQPHRRPVPLAGRARARSSSTRPGGRSRGTTSGSSCTSSCRRSSASA